MFKLENVYRGTNPTSLRVELNNTMFDALEYNSFCFRCNVVKPPRAHHCKTCKRCFLRMDHHCPWIGNCVGLGNHKYFIQFTGYASATMLIGFFEEFYAYYLDKFPNVTTFQDTYMMVNMWTMLVLSSAIGFLFQYQLRNAMKNITTVEDNFPQMQDPDMNPFNKGNSGFKNLETVFGPFQMKTWLLPLDDINSKTKYGDKYGYTGEDDNA